jgi:hypothetical protein
LKGAALANFGDMPGALFLGPLGERSVVAGALGVKLGLSTLNVFFGWLVEKVSRACHVQEMLEAAHTSLRAPLDAGLVSWLYTHPGLCQ